MTTIKKVSIDRFEGEYAVLLLGETPLNILRKLLPEGAKEGDWLDVEFNEDRFVSAKIDPDEKERMKKRIDEKLSKLRSKKGLARKTDEMC